MKKIEFGKFEASESSKKHVMDCLETGWVSIGKKTKQFEDKFASLFDYKHCKAVSSGTSAGMAACMSLYDLKRAKQGDEVICPALSFIATANAIRASGFNPKFVDVCEDMNINTSLIEEAITDKTIAIKAVGLMGKPAKLEVIQEIAKKYNLIVIADNCEAYGSKRKGKFALEYCDMETSSHYVGHLLVGAEGGTVMSNSEEVDSLITSIRSHGRDGTSLYFDHLRYGLNLKPSDIHSALLLGMVDNFWTIFNKRRDNYKFIRNGMVGLEHVAWFTEEEEGDINCPHGFSITLKPEFSKHLEAFKNHLDEYSINWKRNFGSMADHKTFDYMGDKGKYPMATYIGDNGIHVGCHYYLSDDDLEYMTSCVANFLKQM
jgi:dTDP-4-amino-4,6-dideoxygalactose transaminase